jgi:hypothetical protein
MTTASLGIFFNHSLSSQVYLDLSSIIRGATAQSCNREFDCLSVEYACHDVICYSFSRRRRIHAYAATAQFWAAAYMESCGEVPGMRHPHA